MVQIHIVHVLDSAQCKTRSEWICALACILKCSKIHPTQWLILCLRPSGHNIKLGNRFPGSHGIRSFCGETSIEDRQQRIHPLVDPTFLGILETRLVRDWKNHLDNWCGCELPMGVTRGKITYFLLFPVVDLVVTCLLFVANRLNE